MTWNVALALLPLLAAVVLCGRDAVAHRSMLWWAGLHRPGAVPPERARTCLHRRRCTCAGEPARARPSTAVSPARLGVLFTYGVLFAVGVVSYVLSLHLLGDYLTRAGWTAAGDGRPRGRRCTPPVRDRDLPRALPGSEQLGRASAGPADVAGGRSAVIASPFGAATVHR